MMTMLHRESQYTMKELRVLAARFAAHATPENTLTRAGFKTTMMSAYPQLASRRGRAAVAVLFDLFDDDMNNEIDFAEFVLALSRMSRGTFDEKLDFVFRACDPSGDGRISVPELMGLVTRSYGSFMEMAEFTQQLLMVLDANGDGFITREEFKTTLEHSPVLYDVFFNSVLPGMDEAAGVFKNLRKRLVNFSLDTLFLLWRTARENPGDPNDPLAKPHEITREGFRRFMTDNVVAFRHAPDAGVILNRMFDMLNPAGAHSLPWITIFNAMARLAKGEPEEKTRFLFELYASPHSGTIERARLDTLLQDSRSTAQRMRDAIKVALLKHKAEALAKQAREAAAAKAAAEAAEGAEAEAEAEIVTPKAAAGESGGEEEEEAGQEAGEEEEGEGAGEKTPTVSVSVSATAMPLSDEVTLEELQSMARKDKRVHAAFG